MRPQGAGRFVVDKLKRRQREIVSAALRGNRPFVGACETVPGEFTEGAELREGDRNAATDRRAAIKDGALGEEEVFRGRRA
jgi:hypothetical protein